VGWACRPSKKVGRDAHPTITIKIVSYLIRDPYLVRRYWWKLAVNFCPRSPISYFYHEIEYQRPVSNCIFRAGETPTPRRFFASIKMTAQLTVQIFSAVYHQSSASDDGSARSSLASDLPHAVRDSNRRLRQIPVGTK
jgi:hypothetical protein